MAELLNYINNCIGKYNVKDLLDKKIAIRIRTIDDFNKAQYKIKEYYTTANILNSFLYIQNSKNLCINVENLTEDNTSICYCYKEWYEENSYEILEMEDILWNS